ncbi:MAG: hypothetical protein A3K68_00240 [Euryarchaeota archaeon RBG_16_68_13]|nr:MAG: hypothetical protein A3K68_00240 [Euryarchaeota archaeon RBG_16_68_13]
MRSFMQIGCGATTKEIRGRRYTYFWHFEDRGGRRVQVFQYMGPSARDSTRFRVAEAIDAYYARASEEIRRRRAEALSRVMPA